MKLSLSQAAELLGYEPKDIAAITWRKGMSSVTVKIEGERDDTDLGHVPGTQDHAAKADARQVT